VNADQDGFAGNQVSAPIPVRPFKGEKSLFPRLRDELPVLFGGGRSVRLAVRGKAQNVFDMNGLIAETSAAVCVSGADAPGRKKKKRVWEGTRKLSSSLFGGC
jgi:hypothetical protein